MFDAETQCSMCATDKPPGGGPQTVWVSYCFDNDASVEPDTLNLIPWMGKKCDLQTLHVLNKM